MLWRDQSVFVLNTRQRGLLGLSVPFHLYFRCNITPWVRSISPLPLACWDGAAPAPSSLLAARVADCFCRCQRKPLPTLSSRCRQWVGCSRSCLQPPSCPGGLVGPVPSQSAPPERAGALCTGKDFRPGCLRQALKTVVQREAHLPTPCHKPAFNCSQMRLGNVNLCFA